MTEYESSQATRLDRNLLRIKLRMLNKLANVIISDGFANIILF
jgi:hypothetical protein